MTLSVTTTSSIAVSEALVTSTDADTQTFNSFTTQQSLSYASVPDSPGLSMVIGGEATAIGEDTLAAASMTVEVDSTGLVTTALGSVSFVAAAVSPGHETAFATADSFGGMSGADFLLVLTSNTQIVDQGPDESVAIATSSTMLYGADFGLAAADTSVATNSMLAPSTENEFPAIADFATSDQDHDTPADDFWDSTGVEIDGNVAVLDIVAAVFGPDTLLDVEASVLTLDNTLSTISAEIIAAVG